MRMRRLLIELRNILIRKCIIYAYEYEFEYKYEYEYEYEYNVSNPFHVPSQGRI